MRYLTDISYPKFHSIPQSPMDLLLGAINFKKEKKKKKTQWQSCELSFIWGQMKTIAQETAFQITLRNCSKDIEGRSVYT